jgi:hypothetical protein
MELINARFARASIDAPRLFVAKKGRQLNPVVEIDGTFINFASGFVVTATLEFRGEYEQEGTAAITAAAELELLFRSDISMTEEFFETFKRSTLPIYSYPYFREFLHSAIGRTGWPVYTLPTFRWEPAAIAAEEAATAAGGLSE